MNKLLKQMIMRNHYLMALGVAMFAVTVFSETVDVPAVQTVKYGPEKRFSGDVLVKSGPGTLDLCGALLNNQGLEIREGTVRISAQNQGPATVSAKYLRWNVTKTRPGNAGAPEWAGSGSQFSEFRLFLDGKPVVIPAGTKPFGPQGGGAVNEGVDKGYDGDLKTKCYRNPFTVEFGSEAVFNGYSFVTANDAIGRDPDSWTLEIGHKIGDTVYWTAVGSVNGFVAPAERFTAAGKVFPLAVKDVVPPGYPVKICGKGVLALKDAIETLENVSGDGLIMLENASVDFAPGCVFSGTVSGNGQVRHLK